MLVGNTDVANMGSKIRTPVIGVSDNNPSTVSAYTANGGVSWSTPAINSNRWGDVAYNGAGLFVAVSRTNTDTATSPDGLTWTNHAAAMPGPDAAVGLVFGAGVFVAFCNSINKCYTSTDGISWTSHAMPAGVSASTRTQCFGGSSPVFCAIAQGTSNAATSPDGSTWTARTITGAALNWQCIAWNGSVFCAGNQTTTATSTSPDGINWTAHTGPWAMGSMTSDGTQFVATQFGGTGVATSPDGINWTTRTTAFAAGVHTGCLCWDGAEFIGISSGDGATSPDGIVWTGITPPSNAFQGICSKQLTFGTF